MVERQPRQGQPARPLLDFPILPDTVSSSIASKFFLKLTYLIDQQPRRAVVDRLMAADGSPNTLGRYSHAYRAANPDGGNRKALTEQH